MSSASDWMRRAGTFALVLMLVTSMVAPSAMAATTSASTPDDSGVCRSNYGSYMLEALTRIGTSVDDLQQKCKAQEMVANVTHADIYASSLALDDLRKSSTISLYNHLQDSKTYARTIAKTEAVKLFNNQSNGLNKSQIKAEVNASIEDYYASLEHNLISSYRANANQVWYNFLSKEQSLSMFDMGVDKGSTANDPYPYAPKQDSGPSAMTNSTSAYHRTTKNGTLVNGTNVTFPIIYDSDDGGSTSYSTTSPYPSSESRLLNIYTKKVNASNDDWESYVPAFQPGYYYGQRANLHQNASDMKVEAAAFVELLYTNYNRSEGVDVSEVLSPNDIVSQWNTNYNSTGYYGWIAATLGMTGLEGNVNASFAITYSPRVNHTDNGNYTLSGNGSHDYAYVAGESYNASGTLMTDWDPNPNESYAFQRGSTYDTANADAPVLFIEQLENDSRVVRLNGTFTVSELTNVQTGETINSTSLEEQNKQTWNESSSITEIRKLVEYRNKSVEAIQAGGGTGGGGGFNFGFDAGMAGIGALVALGAGLYLVSSGASKAS